MMSRVENRRSGCSLPVAVDGAFATSPQSGLTWLWFLFPLIEPDRRFSRIRLSEKGSRVCPRKADGSSIETNEPTGRGGFGRSTAWYLFPSVHVWRAATG